MLIQTDGKYGRGTAAGFGAFPLDVDLVNQNIQFPHSAQNGSGVFNIVVFHVNDHVPKFVNNFFFPEGQNPDNNEHQGIGKQDTFIKTGTNGQSDAGRCPQAGGGCNAFYLLFSGDNDGTGTQKTDAVNDLGTKTGDIHVGAGGTLYRQPDGAQHLQLILSQQNSQTGTKTNQKIRTETGSPAFTSAFQTNQSAEEHGKCQPQKKGFHIQFTEGI